MSTPTQRHAPNGFAELSADYFAQQFDLDRPEVAMSSYQRLMHQHTKQQFELATASSRRRSTNSSIGTAILSKEESNDSVTSTAS